MQAVAEEQFLTRLRRVRRIPEGDDVVVEFRGCRNLYQLYGAFAPAGLGFDPQARSALVERVIVLIMACLLYTSDAADDLL